MKSKKSRRSPDVIGLGVALWAVVGLFAFLFIHDITKEDTMAEPLIAASVRVHSASEKKQPEGSKTQRVDFIEIDLVYEGHTEIVNDTITLKKRLNNEDIEPAQQGRRHCDSRSNHRGGLQQHQADLFSAQRY